MPISHELNNLFTGLMASVKNSASMPPDLITQIEQLSPQDIKILFSEKQNGESLLIKSAQYNLEILDLLLKPVSRLELEDKREIFNATNASGQTFLTSIAAKIRVLNARSPTYNQLFTTVFLNPDFYTLTNQEGAILIVDVLHNPLTPKYLCEHICSQIERFSIELKANLFTAVDSQGNNALMQSISFHHNDIVNQLILIIKSLPSETLYVIFSTKNSEGKNVVEMLKEYAPNDATGALSIVAPALINIEYSEEVFRDMGFSLSHSELLAYALENRLDIKRALKALNNLSFDRQKSLLTSKVNYTTTYQTRELTLLEIIVEDGSIYLYDLMAVINKSFDKNKLMYEIFSVVDPFRVLALTPLNDERADLFSLFLNVALEVSNTGTPDFSIQSGNSSHFYLAKQLIYRPKHLADYLFVVERLIPEQKKWIFLGMNPEDNIFKLILRNKAFRIGNNKDIIRQLLGILITTDIDFQQACIINADLGFNQNLIAIVMQSYPELLPDFLKLLEGFPLDAKTKLLDSTNNEHENLLMLAMQTSTECAAGLLKSIEPLPKSNIGNLSTSVIINPQNQKPSNALLFGLRNKRCNFFTIILQLKTSLQFELFTAQHPITHMNFLMLVLNYYEDLIELNQTLALIDNLSNKTQNVIFAQQDAQGKNILFQAIDRNIPKKNFKELLNRINSLPVETKQLIFTSKYRNQNILDYSYNALYDFESLFPPTVVSFSLSLQLSMSKSEAYKKAFKTNLNQRIKRLHSLGSTPEVELIKSIISKMHLKADLKKATILDELDSIYRASEVDTFNASLNAALKNPDSALSKALNQQRLPGFFTTSVTSSKKNSDKIPLLSNSLEVLIEKRYPLNTPAGKSAVRTCLDNAALDHAHYFEARLKQLLNMSKPEKNDISYIFSICAKIHFNKFLESSGASYDSRYLLDLAEKISSKGYKINSRTIALKILESYRCDNSVNFESIRLDDILRLFQNALNDSLFNRHETLGGFIGRKTGAISTIESLINQLNDTMISTINPAEYDNL